MSRKPKHKTRPARRVNARHQAQQAARERATYDRQVYDGNEGPSEEVA